MLYSLPIRDFHFGLLRLRCLIGPLTVEIRTAEHDSDAALAANALTWLRIHRWRAKPVGVEPFLLISG
jgi:hypothetical protein